MPGVGQSSYQRRRNAENAESQNTLQETGHNPAPAPVPTFSPMVPASLPSTPAVTTPSYEQQIVDKLPGYTATPAQIQAAMQSMLPAYQARLGGFDSATAQAMRNKGMSQIQAQYGAGLRAAMNQAGQQGIRGPASVAMQQDIRNQMGQATAGFERDLNIANWDAGRQALADYYGAATGERAMDLGSLAGLQQLKNYQQAGNAYQQGLQGMNTGSGGQIPFAQAVSSVWPSWLQKPPGVN